MRRIALFLCLMTAAVLLPTSFFEHSDVSDLKPVELIYIDKVQDILRVATEESDEGYGAAPEDAFNDLKATASGMIFLDTVEYILISPQAADLLPELDGLLRPGCGIALCCDGIDLHTAAEFLGRHKPKVTLAQFCAQPRELPILKLEGERLRLVQP